MLDVDAYERKLDKARTEEQRPGDGAASRGAVREGRRDDSRTSATKLVEDLTLLDANRFELARAFLCWRGSSRRRIS